MKIYYIANVRLPTEKAHGIQIMKTCEALAAKGASVHLIVPSRRNPIKADPFVYYSIKKSFKITKLPTLDLVGVIPRFGFLVQSVSFAQFATAYLFFKKADAFYSRDELPLWFLSFLKRDLYWESHRGQHSLFARRLLKRCKGIIVISQGLRDYYLSKGVRAEKVLVAPDGVDLEQFGIPGTKYEIRQQLDLPKDKFIVAYTGHLYDWKGAKTLLKVARLYSEHSDTFVDSDHVLFVFVGGTEEDIEKFRKEARGLENVLIFGHKPHSDIPRYLVAADVLALPNSAKNRMSQLYTSPLKLFEYMAAKRPIVASDIPSLREVLDETNAVLVESDNTEALADGIKKFAEDERLASRIAEQAYHDVQNYTWQKRAHKVISFLRD